MSIAQGHQTLEQLTDEMRSAIKNGARPEPTRVTVQEFLSWFGHKRRGKNSTRQVKGIMDQLNLCTVPDFLGGWNRKTVSIELKQEVVSKIGTPSLPADPTVRIGTLEAANRAPVRAHPDNTLSSAMTKMLTDDYSQLPVMTTDHKVEGVVSWHSIGTRLAHGSRHETVRDCTDPHVEVSSNDPFLDAIDIVAMRGYALVRGSNNTVSGIITYSDLG